MPNHIKFCGCRACRAGRHRPFNKFIIRLANRVFRRKAKEALKKGETPSNKTTVTYTD